MKPRGFTLIEVLLATVLLSAGLALAFATLSAASQTATRGEAMAMRGERMRAVEGFLRKRLAAARPLAYETEQVNLVPQRFVGSADRMRFVADLPNYLGQGGPYLHDLQVERHGEGVRMVLGLSMVLAGETVEDNDARPPEPLVEGLEFARFRYRGLTPERELGEWQDEWVQADQLPMLVEVTFADVDGREWPPLVVALPQGAGAPPGMGGLR